VVATRSSKGEYALFYFPTGKSIRVNLNTLTAKNLYFKWYDPRTGVTFDYPLSSKKRTQITINPPSQGRGNDWILMVDGEN
jgi:hypothetical protein